MEGMEAIVFLIDINEMSMVEINKENKEARYLDISGGYKAKEVPLALYHLESGGYMAGDDAYLFIEEEGTLYTAEDLHQNEQLMEYYFEECMKKIQEIYPEYCQQSYEVIELPTKMPDAIEDYKNFYKNKIAEVLEVEKEDKRVQRLFYEHRTLWLKQLKTGKGLKIPMVYDGKMKVLALSADSIVSIRRELRRGIMEWQTKERALNNLVNNELMQLSDLMGIKMKTTDWLAWYFEDKTISATVEKGLTRRCTIQDKGYELEWNLPQPITWIAMDGVHRIDVVDTQGNGIFTGLLPRPLHGYLVTMEATLDNHHIISEVTYEFRKL